MRKTLFTALIGLMALSAVAQEQAIDAVQAFYQSQQETEILSFFPTDSLPIQQIILFRHGEPDLNKKGWRNRKAAEQFIIDYDSAKVIPFSNSPIASESIHSNTIFHSPLPRAKHTAQLLFPEGFTLNEDERFRELERKIMKFFNMKLPLKSWTRWSRVFWLMGLNDRGIESRKEGKKRVRENAIFLENYTNKNQQAVLVAHGMHNHMLVNALKKRGWKLVRKGGSGYWAANVLAKPQE